MAYKQRYWGYSRKTYKANTKKIRFMRKQGMYIKREDGLFANIGRVLFGLPMRENEIVGDMLIVRDKLK